MLRAPRGLVRRGVTETALVLAAALVAACAARPAAEATGTAVPSVPSWCYPASSPALPPPPPGSECAFPIPAEPDSFIPIAAVEGRVVDPSGRPVVGATVHGEYGIWSISPVKVGGDGAFRLDGLKPGEGWITAEAPGYKPKRVDTFFSAEHLRHIEVVLAPCEAC